MAPKTTMKVVFGSMTIGKPDTLGARVHTAEEGAKIIDTFQAHGHKEIDTARIYGNGTTEELLAAIDWQKRGIAMATKLYPNGASAFSFKAGALSYTHTPEDVHRGFEDSVKALGCEKIDMFYLHGPDRTHPFEDTLRAVNELYVAGKFKRWGVSNYQSWEVAKMCEICEKNGWVKPVAYQGVYHALQRRTEDELFPCLRHYGISFYAFQPLAGGFLTGRYTRDMEADSIEKGSRFDKNTVQGAMTRSRYWHDEYFDALDILKAAADKHQLTLGEVALRWMEHHSMMKPEYGDAIIVGASSVKHLEDNLTDLEKGPLPEDILVALEEGWKKVRGIAPKYWH
ncbi:hypothetical protein HYALB_00007540 [Hymenoscyphus albidus]|uniref:NADP-dependent oxidoreductase domain-containing protein n=1 Tax=Hymenoscyphus albidus TaxID=595503 RepID=A0A9N9LKX6_9HELO|nr:hypothetical protein HYALB_00007540 [Hymenoscyphus albidus]